MSRKTRLYSTPGYCGVMPAKGTSGPLVLGGTFRFEHEDCLRVLAMWATDIYPRAIERFGASEAEWWSGFPGDGKTADKLAWLRAKGFTVGPARIEVTPSPSKKPGDQ